MTTISEQMAAWGREGGKARSEKKREAARKNLVAARAQIGKAVPQPSPAPHPVEMMGQPPACVIINDQKTGAE